MEESAYKYLYETHCHNCWCSACGQSTPQEMAEAYLRAGYAGMVITDHFLLGNSAVDKNLPWSERVGKYYDAYLAAKKWAEDEGADFDVIFGLEHHYGNGKEVLTYGIDLSFLIAHPDIHLLPLGEYSRLVHEAGGFISMAHPFRDRGYINMEVGPEPEHLDAVEAYNFHNYPEENLKARELAREEGLLCTSGGDIHVCTDPGLGRAGVAFRQRVRTGAELVAALRSGDYMLLEDGNLTEPEKI